MNYITLFLRKFKNHQSEQKISLEDVEFIINERLNEKTRLEKILKTLRWQASSQLEEIKNLSISISSHRNQKESLVEQIELLNNDYLKILESFEIEKEKLLVLQDKLANLDTEKLKIDEFNKQINLLENEYEQAKQNVSKENEELKRLRNEKLVLIKNKIKYKSVPEKKQKKKLTKKKHSTRCKAKTKSNHRCKNHTTNDSGFCHMHEKALAPKRKMKLVNFNG